MKLNLLVDCHKIISWLEDRKKLPNNWYDSVKASEETIKSLLATSLSEFPNIAQYIVEQKESFIYRDVMWVVEEILKTKAAQQKTLLFGYSDKRVKEWTSLKKFMDNKLIGLVNSAKWLEQVLNFELPSLSKGIQLLDSQVSTLKRKIDYNNNTIYQQQEELSRLKQELGIIELLPAEELAPILVKSVPNQIASFHTLFKSANIEKYLEVHGKLNELNGTANDLNMIRYFLQNGDQFVEVYRGGVSTGEKYAEFLQWRAQNEWQIVDESQPKQRIITNVNLETIIECKQTRQLLLQQLNELLYMFKGLCQQIKKGKASSQLSEHLNIVSGDIELAENELSKLIEVLTNKKLTSPIQMKKSKKAYKIFVNKFSAFEQNISSMKEQIVFYGGQIEQLIVLRQKEVAKLNRNQQKALLVKYDCEKWLSELVKNEVKITGDINKLE